MSTTASPISSKYELNLSGKVAVVTGASRGVGRGVAVALARCGAKVYCAARTMEARETKLRTGGSLAETVEMIRSFGGEATAIRCDVTDDRSVEELFAEVARQQNGRLDLLVNTAWGGYERYVDGSDYEDQKPFWEQPLHWWDAMFNAGVRSYYTCTRQAAKLMVPRRDGLVVTVSFFAGRTYMKPVLYGVAKAATDRLVADTAIELREHGVTSVALYPGLVRTESVLLNAEYFDMSNSESPEFQGRAVAALLADGNRISKTGKVFVSAELALEYKFTDTDGKQPHSVRWQYQTV